MSKLPCLHFTVDSQIIAGVKVIFFFYLPSLPLYSQTHLWPELELTISAPVPLVSYTGSPVDLHLNEVSEWGVLGWHPTALCWASFLSVCLFLLPDFSSKPWYPFFCCLSIPGHYCIHWRWAGQTGFVPITSTFSSLQSLPLTLALITDSSCLKGKVRH